MLRPEYIDELVEAGMTDVGSNVNGLQIETFERITGVKDRQLAEKL